MLLENYIFSNRKPWMDSTVQFLLKAQGAAYWSGYILAYSRTWKELKKGSASSRGCTSRLAGGAARASRPAATPNEFHLEED